MKIYLISLLILTCLIASSLCDTTLEGSAGGNSFKMSFSSATDDPTRGIRVEIETTLTETLSYNDYYAVACAPHDDGTTLSGTSNNGFVFYYGWSGVPQCHSNGNAGLQFKPYKSKFFEGF